MTLETVVVIMPDGGLIHITAKTGDWRREMRLAAVGQSADEGIPSWKTDIPGSNNIEKLINNKGEST
jgi:hypothetical protein